MYNTNKYTFVCYRFRFCFYYSHSYMIVNVCVNVYKTWNHVTVSNPPNYIKKIKTYFIQIAP